jgi:peptidoglycan/LPS O-acetylase OafA/YrhL
MRSVPLGSLAQGRHNNFQLIRLLAASVVIVFHCYALTNHWTDEPLWKLAPELNFGTLGVKCFFVVSGFLVTQSWLARRRLVAFTIARALRIYPALIAATLFGIALAAWSSAVPLGAFLADPQTLDYAWRNALAWEVRDQLPGAYVSNPFPNSVNGSLWTLPIELRLYVVLGACGVLGVLARRHVWLVAVAGLTALFSVMPEWYPLAQNSKVTRELALCFALGSLAYAWRDRIPLSVPGIAVALALVVLNPAGLARGALFDPLLAYAVLTLAYHPALQWPTFNRAGDYSYGLYIYAFPIQQTLVRLWPAVPPVALLAAALPLALATAALSWHLIEKPALGLKSRFS